MPSPMIRATAAATPSGQTTHWLGLVTTDRASRKAVQEWGGMPRQSLAPMRQPLGMALGVLEVSFLLLVGMWFYTQSSHESREHAYYFAGSGPTPSDLVAHGLGPLPDSATGQHLYLDTMKRSLLVSSLGSGLKPVFVVLFSWVVGWVVCVCSFDLSRLSL